MKRLTRDTIGAGDRRELEALNAAIESNVQAAEQARKDGRLQLCARHSRDAFELSGTRLRLLKAIAVAEMNRLGIEPWRVLAIEGLQ